MTDAMDKTEAGPNPDTTPEMPAAPASLGGMSAADLDWVENWLIQKRGTEHAARPYGKGSLLLTTLIFEVRREQRHRDTASSTHTAAQRIPCEAEQIKRGERTGVIVGIGLPTLLIAAVVAGLMWWHTGGVLPQ